MNRTVLMAICMVSIFITAIIVYLRKDANMHGTLKSIKNINYAIRKGTLEDELLLKQLYQRVAAIPGGLARTPDEITNDYIHKIVTNGVNRGLLLVVQHDGELIGAMSKFKFEPKTFAHVMGDGSILIDPRFQGQGIGSNLIRTFLQEIELYHPDIMRIELIARESNPAIKLYERMGFKKEGRFENRISSNKGFEADIPMVWINPKFNSQYHKK